MKYLFALLLLPGVVQAQQSCIDSCFAEGSSFICSSNSQTNYDVYGEVMGNYCGKVLGLIDAYEEIQQQTIFFFEKSIKLKRRVRRARRELKRCEGKQKQISQPVDGDIVPENK